MIKEEYKGIHGFKNGAPAYARDNWGKVDLFLHTWDFLPNDDSVLESLTKEQLILLCNYALTVACKIDLTGDGIKFIQEKMHKWGISPDAKKERA